MSAPTVSVVMSVYNGEQFLKETIDSILNQTFTDFEFVIIDDGSTDGSKKVINSYKDKRITYIYQENQGITGALNNGIAATKSQLIARIDSDDIAHPSRLKEQVDYLNKHPECVLVGSNLLFIDEQGNEILKSPMLLHDAEIKLELLVRSPFGHPAVAFRKEQFLRAGSYTSEFKVAEDYDLWIRLSKFGSFANINLPLLQYRINDAGVSRKNTTSQLAQAQAVTNKAWATVPPQLKGVSFTKILNQYKADDDTSKQQLGRLSDICLTVVFSGLRRGRLLFASKVLLIMISSPTGVYNLIKSIKRKVWR